MAESDNVYKGQTKTPRREEWLVSSFSMGCQESRGMRRVMGTSTVAWMPLPLPWVLAGTFAFLQPHDDLFVACQGWDRAFYLCQGDFRDLQSPTTSFVSHETKKNCVISYLLTNWKFAFKNTKHAVLSSGKNTRHLKQRETPPLL